MVRVKVEAKLALFERPDLHFDKCSYDMITPTAAIGVMESIYWHPGLLWIIDRIYVMNPIKFVNLTPESNHKTIALRDVQYVIDAHFDMTKNANSSDNPGKFQDIVKRRLKRKEYYSDVYLGSKEYPAEIEEYKGEVVTPLKGIYNMGLMLYNFDYNDRDNPIPIFFRAKLKDGVLDLRKEIPLLLR